MAIEKELKLTLPHADITNAVALLDKFSGKAGVTAPLQNIYFDTPALDLADARVALRVRRTPDGWLQTLKTAGTSKAGLHARGEWEMPIASEALDLPALLAACDDKQAAESIGTLAQDVQPVFHTDFDRTTWEITRAGTVIEAALDLGWVYTDSDSVSDTRRLTIHPDTRDSVADTDSRIAICEIELELKSGTESELMQLAAELRGALPSLSADDVSKAARGYQLARARQQRAAHG